MVNRQNDDALILDRIRRNHWRIGNDQLARSRNPARPARHGKGGQPFHGSKNAQNDSRSNFLAVREGDVVVSLI